MSKPSGKKSAKNRERRLRECANILAHLAANPFTTRETLMHTFGLTLSEAKKRLKALSDQELIRFVYSESTTAWTLGRQADYPKHVSARDRSRKQDPAQLKLLELPSNLMRMFGIPPAGFEPPPLTKENHILEKMPNIPISSHKYCAGAGSCAALDMA